MCTLKCVTYTKHSYFVCNWVKGPISAVALYTAVVHNNHMMAHLLLLITCRYLPSHRLIKLIYALWIRHLGVWWTSCCCLNCHDDHACWFPFIAQLKWNNAAVEQLFLLMWRSLTTDQRRQSVWAVDALYSEVLSQWWVSQTLWCLTRWIWIWYMCVWILDVCSNVKNKLNSVPAMD